MLEHNSATGSAKVKGLSDSSKNLIVKDNQSLSHMNQLEINSTTFAHDENNDDYDSVRGAYDAYLACIFNMQLYAVNYNVGELIKEKHLESGFRKKNYSIEV
jgi:hypothetical protein